MLVTQRNFRDNARFARTAVTMNLHEYQAKDIFRSYGIAVPAGRVAANADEAAAAAEAIGGSVWVVKAQVHAGGRGKAGGVKARPGYRLPCVRPRTAHARHSAWSLSRPARRTACPSSASTSRWGSEIEREIYLSLTLNRERGRIALIASAAGGMDIEEVAAKTPEKILTVNIHPGRWPAALTNARQIAFGLGLKGTQIAEFQVDRHGALQVIHRQRRQLG